jgi:hypothetical protein
VLTECLEDKHETDVMSFAMTWTPLLNVVTLCDAIIHPRTSTVMCDDIIVCVCGGGDDKVPRYGLGDISTPKMTSYTPSTCTYVERVN